MSLENGAVVKRMIAQTGSTMLAEPRWFYDTQTSTAVIYLIGFNTTSTTSPISLAGIGTVRMQLNQTKTNTTSYTIPVFDPTEKIYVKYKHNTNADYSTAWANYFTNTLGMTQYSSDATSEVYYFTQTPSTLVITNYEINIKSV